MYLISIELFNGHTGLVRVFKRNKSKTFGLLRLFVNINFGGNNVSYSREKCEQISVGKALWEMINKQVGAVWSRPGPTNRL